MSRLPMTVCHHELVLSVHATWIGGRDRYTDFCSKDMWLDRGWNSWPPEYQSDGAYDWASGSGDPRGRHFISTPKQPWCLIFFYSCNLVWVPSSPISFDVWCKDICFAYNKDKCHNNDFITKSLRKLCGWIEDRTATSWIPVGRRIWLT